MNNAFIASELNVSAIDLTMHCSKPRGTHLTWVIREILMREWNHLQAIHKDYLIEFLLDLMLNKRTLSVGKSDALEKGQLVLKDDYLQRLFAMYGKLSPLRGEL